MPKDIGVDTGVLVDGVDLSDYYHTARLSSLQEAPVRTTFRPVGRWHSYIAGLMTATLSLSGYTAKDYDAVLELLQQVKGLANDGQDVLVGIGSFEPGNLTIAVKSLHTGFNLNESTDVITDTSADFQGIPGSPSAALGVSLWTPFGSDTIASNSILSITLDEILSAGNVVFPATPAGAGGTVSIAPGDSAATVKAAIEALPGYDTVNVTGSSNAVLEGNQATSGAALASSEAGVGKTKDRAFDGNSTTGWEPIAMPAWIGNDLGSAKEIAIYRLFFHGAGNFQIKSWTFEAADDAAFTTNLVVLDTVENHVIAGTGWVEFPIDAPQSKRYHRLNISAFNNDFSGSKPVVYEMQMLLAGTVLSSGSYQIEVAAPAATEIAAPTTTKPGFTVERLQAGGTLERANLVAAVETGAAVIDLESTELTTDAGALIVMQLQEQSAAAGVDKTITVLIEHSPDNGAGAPTVWSTLVALDAMTSPGPQRALVEPGVTIHPHLRARVSEVTGNHAFAVGFHRYY